jgi:hypothetical protein
VTDPADGEHFLYGLMRGRYPDHPELGHVVDLGHDVRVTLTVRTEGGPPIGLVESHRAPDGTERGGSVTFDVPEAEGLRGPRWQVVSLDPLHIEPSILCSCGHHGFIREGRWVPC